jgi:UDPglucose 6-dehydrogenase/GDP-mannose 6-dehydrogenase
MIKYTSNALLATLISFSNEIARYCEAVGDVDVADVMTGVHLMTHLSYRDGAGALRRVSAATFLWSGCGFGGSCFPKDVRALIASASHHHMEPQLLQAVMRVNDTQPARMIELLRKALPTLAERRVVVLGLAFKPGTDDVRESPALKIIADLVTEGARVVCHDPVALGNGRVALADKGVPVDAIVFEDDLEAAITGADAVVLVTSWSHYLRVPQLLAAFASPPPLIDGRRFFRKTDYDRYFGVGLAPRQGMPALSGVE